MLIGLGGRAVSAWWLQSRGWFLDRQLRRPGAHADPAGPRPPGGPRLRRPQGRRRHPRVGRRGHGAVGKPQTTCCRTPRWRSTPTRPTGSCGSTTPSSPPMWRSSWA